MSILLYGCNLWTITKHIEKKLDGNYTRMLLVILNKSWKQNPTKQQMYSHQPSISKTIQIRQTRHAGHCRRSRSELISDFLEWTPTRRHASAGQPTRIFLRQLCSDTGFSLVDVPEAMDDRDKWQ